MRTIVKIGPSSALTNGGERLAGIDGLRAIAMTMVIAQHCGLLPFGWIGVWLFFVISGYVITRGFIAEESSVHLGRALPSAGRRYGAFVRRRLLRIVPAYALYVGACVLLFAIPYGMAGSTDLIGLITFTYNWQMVFQPAASTVHWPAIAHLWTLSVEQQFYVFFPLLFLGVPERWRWKLACALVLLAPLTRWLWLLVVGAAMPDADAGRLAFSVYAATICQIDAFLLGALIARFQPQLLRNPRLPMRWLWMAVASVAVFGVIYMSLNYARGDRGADVFKNIFSGTLYGQGRELFGYSVINLFAAGVLLVTIAGVRGTAWLSKPWMTWIGRISYGGYLFHALVLWGLSDSIGEQLKYAPTAWRVAGFATVFMTTVGLASLSFSFFEQPIARRFKTWASRRASVPRMLKSAKIEL
ncbi:acyltransferase [Variovorax sp. LG9.2]|jgi:peptidoglycan/LPS O-acetylase OafA/YrhL|uniref:acyltransferase family protein n=1 Tax=Variovorax sp. LG9.2 TaxID=3048626 RepID=UPI002B2228CF|nr:acyltransferase [Variovorax sp. LG9.2]MEB0059212.1 acyltransferase [Variovorax sp. LG9.2]